MNVLISASGKHLDAAGARVPHWMVVDNHGLLLDLSGVLGNLVDPTITAVTWGLQRDGNDLREGGTIVRQDGHRQAFWDRGLIEPYLKAWKAKKAEIEVDPRLRPNPPT